MLIDIKMKKKPVAELGHYGRLKIYVDPKKSTSISQKCFEYLAEILYGV